MYIGRYKKILDKWIPNSNKKVYKKVIKAFLLPIAYLKSKIKYKEKLSEKTTIDKIENREELNENCKIEKLNFITI